MQFVNDNVDERQITLNISVLAGIMWRFKNKTSGKGQEFVNFNFY